MTGPLRFLTGGESHGPAQVAILEGIPADLPLTIQDINHELKKRHSDFGRGGRGLIEKDKVKILSGVRFGQTLGSPITLLVENIDFRNWKDKMAVADNPKIDKEDISVNQPRPGHADLAGALKYSQGDIRNVLERASARETVTRVAIGAVCKKLLTQFNVEIASHTVQIGPVRIKQTDYKFEEITAVFSLDPELHCLDTQAREKMKQAILSARVNKNTLGGVVEIVAHNVPIGLGSVMHFDRKIDGRIAQALMSIPSVKAIEIGNAIEISGKTGREAHDAIFLKRGKIVRGSNNMGGIEGGMTNGEDVVCRVFHKPLSTLYRPLPTINLKTLKPDLALVERSDVSVVTRAGVISEAMLAFVLAQAFLEKFGGDHLRETTSNFRSFSKTITNRLTLNRSDE